MISIWKLSIDSFRLKAMAIEESFAFGLPQNEKDITCQKDEGGVNFHVGNHGHHIHTVNSQCKLTKSC
jgi:hypothetical protein